MEQLAHKTEDLLVDLQEVCFKLTETSIDRLKSQIMRHPPRSNWASQVGHPCERYLYHSRVDWEKKDPHNFILQSIFNEGNLHERAVMKEIEEDCNERGWAIVGQQTSFYDEELEIGGKIDLAILIPIKRGEVRVIPAEIKSCAPSTFDQIKTQSDILTASKYYIRNYYDQLMSYLYMHNQEFGILVLKNKLTGIRRYVPIQLDYEHFSETIEKVKRVNKAISEKRPPDRLLDFEICNDCPFRDICITGDIKLELPEMDNDTLLLALEEKDMTKEAWSKHEAAKKVIKKEIERSKEDKFTVGLYVITRKWIEEKIIPSTTRKGYWRNTIKNLEK